MATGAREIFAVLRERMRQGLYPPGSKLPSHRELLREFPVSPVTLQRAFDRLVDLGWATVQRHRGTFAPRVPPDVGAVALVFPGDPQTSYWNRFWSTLLRESEALSDAGQWFRPYFLDGRSGGRGLAELCADLADRGLLGAVFVTDPHLALASDLFAMAFPRVIIGGGRSDYTTPYGASVVRLAGESHYRRVLGCLMRRGASRLGGIVRETDALPGAGLLREFALTADPRWWVEMPITPDLAGFSRGVARLMFSAPPPWRPDGLIVGDDNLLPHVLAGIADAGLASPGGIAIAAHANFPSHVGLAMSVVRYGHDARSLLLAARTEVRRLAGGAPPQVIEDDGVVIDPSTPGG
jgi:hypothetical protein